MRKLFLGLIAVAAYGQNIITVLPGSAATGELRFLEIPANGTNMLKLKGQVSMAGDVNVVWPSVAAGNYTLTFREFDNGFTALQSFNANVRLLRATEFLSSSILFTTLSGGSSGNWTLGVQDSTAFPGIETAIALKYQGSTRLLIEDSGDISASYLNLTTGLSSPGVNTTALLVNTIRTNDFSALLIFDSATRDLTNIHNITFTGTLTGTINISGSDLVLTRATEFTSQNVKYANLASGSSGNWFAGVGNSLQFPGSSSAYFIKQQAVNKLVIEGSGDVSIFGALDVSTSISTPGLNTTALLVSTIRTNDFSALLIFDRATRDLTNIHNITFTGTLNGTINISTSDLVLTRATETSSQNVKYANAASGSVGNWFIGAGNSILLPGASSAYFIKHQATIIARFEATGDVDMPGVVSLGATSATSLGTGNVRLTNIVTNDFASLTIFNISTRDLTNIRDIVSMRNLSVTGTVSGVTTLTATNITTTNLTVTGTCTGGGCGATLSANNAWTGTNTFITNDLIVQRATETTTQNIKFQNISTGSAGNWFLSVGNSILLPGASSAHFIKYQSTIIATFEATGDVTIPGVVTLGATGATSLSTGNVRLTNIVTNDFSSFTIFSSATRDLTNIRDLVNIRNLSMTGTCTGAACGAGLGTNNTWTGINTYTNTWETQGSAAFAFATSYSGFAGFIGRAANGFIGSPSAVVTDQQLVGFGGRGWAGSGPGAFTAGNSATLAMNAAEGWTSGAQGSYILLATTPIGSTTRSNKLQINNAIAFDTIKSLNGSGFYSTAGFTADQAFYPRSLGACSSLNPSNSTYGGWGYAGGTTYCYWNNSSLTWNTFNAAGGGVSLSGTNTWTGANTFSNTVTFNNTVTYSPGITVNFGSGTSVGFDNFGANSASIGSLVVNSIVHGFFTPFLDTSKNVTANTITTAAGTNSTLYIGTGGNFYMRRFSGGDANCSGVLDGWAGFRTDTNQLEICSGGVVKKVSLF